MIVEQQLMCLRDGVQLGVCGNGVVEAANDEVCDDGNNVDEDGCSSDCKLFCGNKVVDDGELCDGDPPDGHYCLHYGYDMGVLGCSNTCVKPDEQDCIAFGWNSTDDLPADSLALRPWAFSEDNVFAVGFRGENLFDVPCEDCGRIFHYDGCNWSKVHEGTKPLLSIWANGPDDIYAIGLGLEFGDRVHYNAELVHYDGQKWSILNQSSDIKAPTAIWAESKENIIVATASLSHSGYMYRFDGQAWTEMPVPAGTLQLHKIWGTGDDLFAAGRKGTILHYDGANWAAMDSGTEKSLGGVWGTSSDHVIAVGSGGTIIQHEGNGNWVPMVSGVKANLSDVWCSDRYHCFAVGKHGVVLNYDGNDEKVWTVANSKTEIELLGVHGSSRDNIVAVGYGSVAIQYNGTGWKQMRTPPGPASTGVINGIDGGIIGEGEGICAFAVGSNARILSYDGNPERTWEHVDLPGQYHLKDVWTNDGCNVAFAVGHEGTILEYNGIEWAAAALPPGLDQRHWESVWATSRENVFVVGDEGAIVHYNGTSWTGMNSGVETNLMSVWGADSDYVFAAGSAGTMIRYSASEGAWQPMKTSTLARLLDIWGTDSEHVYAVGEGGTIIHYDGRKDLQWRSDESGFIANFRSIWGNGSDDIWVAGTQGESTILHYGGVKWTPVVIPPTAGRLLTVWGTPGGRHIMAGGSEDLFLLTRFPQ
ncbi:MAG: hypothetical protein MJE77_05905 [Proteobacteria bacterium]|nr:hypothetical protein [Pseudomonadota bacterium]